MPASTAPSGRATASGIGVRISIGQTVRVSVRTATIGSGAGVEILAGEPAQAEIIADDKTSSVARRSLDRGVCMGGSPGLGCAAGLGPGDGGHLAAAELVEFTFPIGQGVTGDVVAGGQIPDLGAAAGRRAPERCGSRNDGERLVAHGGGLGGAQLVGHRRRTPLTLGPPQLAGGDGLTVGQAFGPDVLVLDPAG